MNAPHALHALHAPRALALTIPPDHPAFAGHFPGHPIVPGALLLDEAVLCLAAAEQLDVGLIDVAVAKFLRPVRPGEALRVSYKSTGPARYGLEVRVVPVQGDTTSALSGELAATATLTLRQAAAAQER
jgi:3-hydroxymyristoyl/3-hydroxydecanoyl-(acyl carrier protein) dehydratase